jgi:hypothetical protein
LNDLQSVRETAPIRGKRRQVCGLEHREPDGVMGAELAVELLDYPHWLQTSQGTAGEALVIINDIFDLPALMIAAGEIAGLTAPIVQQRGRQALDFTKAGQRLIRNGVLREA